MVFQPDYEPPAFPRSDFEVVSEFIGASSAEQADELIGFFERQQRAPLADRSVLNSSVCGTCGAATMSGQRDGSKSTRVCFRKMETYGTVLGRLT
jgi:hypothetical protein